MTYRPLNITAGDTLEQQLALFLVPPYRAELYQEGRVTSSGERSAIESSVSASAKIRPATVEDIGAVLDVAVTSGLFLSDEVAALRDVMEDVLEGKQGIDHQVALWTDTSSGPPVGVVYFGSDPMTDRKWDLWMIAVNDDRQGQGIGSELLHYSEAQVRAADGRLLLIETSSLPKFDPTRAFYLRHGYQEVARIPDFYADGDSKVVFAKRLEAEPVTRSQVGQMPYA